MKTSATTLMSVLALASGAMAAETVSPISPPLLDAGTLGFVLDVQDTPASSEQPADAQAAASEPPAGTGEFTLFGPSGKRYGSAGSKAWTIGGLYANNFDEANDFNGHVAWSNFLADDFEFVIEAAGWYFNQPGEDTGGISGSMIFRWHALHDETYSWSVFVDGGIGLLGGFDEVPDGGSEFNFLPRLGGGATFALGPNENGQAPRLMIGARWHHISNARIRGDSDNPARDALAGYIAIVFPF
jgi:Lipid A 3-O-deacylase (PagL)